MGKNHICADCGTQDTSWASVTHGTFLCITCSDVHRSVGTHITKIKGCTGTYLWGPDEVERMQTIGNAVAEELDGTEKISPTTSKQEKQKYVEKKYRDRSCISDKIAHVAASQNCRTVETHKFLPSATLGASQVVAPKVPTTSTMARKATIPDAFFDELFADMENTAPMNEQRRYAPKLATPAYRAEPVDLLGDLEVIVTPLHPHVGGSTTADLLF